MTELQELKIKHARLLGEFEGTIEGVLSNDIPEALKLKLKEKLKELKQNKIVTP